MMLGLADDPQQAAAVLVDAELGPLLKEVGVCMCIRLCMCISVDGGARVWVCWWTRSWGRCSRRWVRTRVGLGVHVY